MDKIPGGKDFEQLYKKEKKKSLALAVVSVVLALSLAGSLVYARKESSVLSTDFSGAPGRNMQGQQFQGGGPGGARGGMNVSQFFNDDGSLDTDEVEDFKQRMPSGSDNQFLDMFKDQINNAVYNGDITQAQADALIKALETDTSTSDSV